MKGGCSLPWMIFMKRSGQAGPLTTQSMDCHRSTAFYLPLDLQREFAEGFCLPTLPSWPVRSMCRYALSGHC